MAVDALWPYVVFSANFTGTNNASLGGYVEGRGKTLTVQAGAPTFSNIWSAQGGADTSAYFNGTSRIETANFNGLNFGSGDYEINFWYRQTVDTGSPASLISASSDSPLQGWRVYLDGYRRICLAYLGGSGLSTPQAIPLNTPTHVSIAKYDGTLYIRLNGLLATSTTIGAPINFVGVLQISGANGPYWPYYGFIDRIEILNGAARHTANFTPETAPLIHYAGQITGVITDNLGLPCARKLFAYDRTTGFLSDTIISDTTTGAYTLITQTLNPHMVVALDDSIGTTFNAICADRILLG